MTHLFIITLRYKYSKGTSSMERYDKGQRRASIVFKKGNAKSTNSAFKESLAVFPIVS